MSETVNRRVGVGVYAECDRMKRKRIAFLCGLRMIVYCTLGRMLARHFHHRRNSASVQWVLVWVCVCVGVRLCDCGFNSLVVVIASQITPLPVLRTLQYMYKDNGK